MNTGGSLMDKKLEGKKDLPKQVEQGGKELEKIKKQAKEYLEGWKRSQADYLNFKRRVEDGRKDMADLVKSDLILKILPVLDNFKRAFKHIPFDQQDSDWVLGIKQLEKQLENILEAEGLERIESLKKPFDPNLHEAILSIEDKNHKSGIIIEETEAGFKLGDKVIRPAKVKVAK